MNAIYHKKDLSIDKQKTLLTEAYEKTIGWDAWVLDCNISWARKSLDISFEEMLLKFDRMSHFTFILRDKPESHYELGISSVTDPTYLLRVCVTEEVGERLLEKYYEDRQND